MTTQTTTTRVLLATIAGALAFLVAGVGGAAAAPAASQQPTNKCWLDVINDWADNNQVDKIYAIPCYTQAIQHLSAYPDIAGYSSAADDIHRAMLAVIHEEGRGAPPSSGGSSSGPTPPSLGGGGTRTAEQRPQEPLAEPHRPALARQRAVDPAPAARARRPRDPALARRRGDLVRPPDADPPGRPRPPRRRHAAKRRSIRPSSYPPVPPQRDEIIEWLQFGRVAWQA